MFGNTANLEMELLKTIHHAEFIVNLKVSVLGKNSYNQIMRKPINVCNFLKNPRSDIGFNIWYQEALKHGSMFENVP